MKTYLLSAVIILAGIGVAVFAIRSSRAESSQTAPVPQTIVAQSQSGPAATSGSPSVTDVDDSKPPTAVPTDDVPKLIWYVLERQPVTKAQMQRWLKAQHYPVMDCDYDSEKPGSIQRCKSGGLSLMIESTSNGVAELDISAQPDSFKDLFSKLSSLLKNGAVVEHQNDPRNPFDPTGQSKILMESYSWTSTVETPCAFPTDNACKRWLLQLIESHDPNKPGTSIHFTDLVVAQEEMRRDYERRSGGR